MSVAVATLEETIKGTLARRLQELGVPLIDFLGVRTYQARILRNFRVSLGFWGRHYWLCSFLDFSMFPAMVTVVISCLGFLVIFTLSEFFGLYDGWWIVILIATFSVSFGWLFFLVFLDQHFNNIIELVIRTRWRTSPYRSFRDDCPKSLRQVVRLVNDSIPGVQFEVEHFGKDPFLFAVLYGERCCIGYWDAPDFNG